MFCPPSCLYALYRVVRVHRHVDITHVRKIRTALHPVESLRALVRAVRGKRRVWWREDVLERACKEAETASTCWMGPLWCRRWTAGPLAAHRLRQKQKATRTHLRYKARSRRNHETGSVGGKQTERTPNSLQPNLHSPPLIQVWNLIKFSVKVSKASVLNDVWQEFRCDEKVEMSSSNYFRQF